MTLSLLYIFEIAAPYIGVSVATISLLFILLQTPFGTRVFDSTFRYYFDKKISDLKHLQDRALADVKHVYERNVEELRAELSHFTDRSKHSNEREYQALIAAWESFVAAYYATLACVARMTSHPDFNQMPNTELEDFLNTSDLDAASRQYIRNSTDKNAAYGRVHDVRIQNEAQKAIWQAREIVRKQSVFIPGDIENQFETTLSFLNSVWAENYVNLTARGSVELTNSLELVSSGDRMRGALRDAVRNRVLRPTSEARSRSIPNS